MFKAIRILRKSLSAAMLFISLAVSFTPATRSEVAALGENPARMALMQKRLAYGMMTIAPDFFVTQYAQATGVDPTTIRALLLAKATGRPSAPDTDADGAATTALADIPATLDTATATLPNRQIKAGGALFVRPD